ncbi:uncharacterized protein LOC134205768 isoform X2 [Armigeres subalbatus]|uniref:uncharacterized protein LOC134205768 isoform X2 n=1 Tax=Armigeres subalbatus TaxID=124917 RepID=UPI002ED20CC0
MDSQIISLVSNHSISGNWHRQQRSLVVTENAITTIDDVGENFNSAPHNNNKKSASRSASSGSDGCGSSSKAKRSALGFATSCYKPRSCKGSSKASHSEEGDSAVLPEKTAVTGPGTSSPSSPSTFFAGTVAATDQVLLKLVQRLASLRSSSGTSNNPKNFSKCKKKKNNQPKCTGGGGPDCIDTEIAAENFAGEARRRPSVGSEVPADKKARSTEDGGPFLPSWYVSNSSFADGTKGVTSAACNEAIIELCWSSDDRTVAVAPESGNYHAEIAPPQRKFSSIGAEDEVCREFDAAIAIVEGYGNASGENLVSIGRIDCISRCATGELVSDSDPCVHEDYADHRAHSDVDCVSCNETVLARQCHRDANNNGVVNYSTSTPTLAEQQPQQLQHYQTEEIMGANVSRHHEKGLTGRRAQSTDNLKSDQTQQYQCQSYNNNNNNNSGKNHITKPVPPDLTPGGEFIDGGGECTDDDCQYRATDNGINSNDRNKFCGSLPNHLDADDACEAIFKQNEFLQTHLKNVLASHQQQQPEYVTVSSSCRTVDGGDGHLALDIGEGDGGSANMNQQQPSLGPSSQQQQHHHHPQQQQQQIMAAYQQSSPFYSNSSGKGSTISSTALGGSTFRSSCSGGDRPDIQLKLPLHRTTVDTGYDQGYGSERSPEDEMPPPLLLMHEAQYNEILASSGLNQQLPASVIEPNDLQRFWNYEKSAASLIGSGEYSFITKDTVFLVQVPKGTRGLGLSVSGGSDSSAPFPGLIRIKRLFPHQAAWATGMLQPGDILLEANGIPLTGLTNYEALEVLRTAANYVTLTVCRPQDEQYRKLSPPSEPPKPPLRNALSSEPQSQVQSPQLSGFVGGPTGQAMQFQHMQYNQQQQMVPYYYPQQQHQQQQQYIYPPQTLAFAPLEPGSISGEFEIILTKQQGSLGFTLRKEDESILGHCVRALVRDPALNDGRIKPGDKIMAVNDVPISQMTHEEAVIFLRQAADVVKLRLYRDQAQTPLSAHSPTLGDRRMELSKSDSTSTVGGTVRPKPNLRPEALNLLTDIAYRKQSTATNNSGGGGSGSTSSSVKSSNASPRRLRRGLPQQQQQQQHRTYDNHGYQHSETSNYSDSETSTIVSQSGSMHHPAGVQMVPGGVFHTPSCRSCGGAGNVSAMVEENLDESYYCDDEIDIESLYEEDDEPQKRPNFLNLAGESGSTPMSSRKPRFQFSVATTNAYELNNLDNEALDAPTMYALNGDPVNGQPAGNDQFISLPCETFLVACKTENDLNADSTDAIYVKHFAHKSPLYSSVNVPLKDTGNNVSEVVDAVEKGGKKSLMKWKGAVLMSDEDETPSSHVYSSASLDDGTSPSLSAETGTGTTSDTPESSLAATMGTSTTTPTTERELEFNGGGIDSDGNKIFTVELNKGWNSRLGFSLQQDSETNRTVVSAIYSESVAAKDGRLKVGDQLLTVNEESVEAMSTAQIINLLRIIRGSICLRLIRRGEQRISIPEQPEDEPQPELDLPPPPAELINPPSDSSTELDVQQTPPEQ